MKSNPASQSTGLFALVFCAVFVVVPAAVSVVAGWLPMWSVGEAVWRRSSLVEVPATISEVALKARKGASKSNRLKYWVVARYRFEWQGAAYISTQVTWPNISRGAEKHNTDLFLALDAARESGAPVAAWVDPQDPSYAVLDKSLPWGWFLIAVPIAIVFSGVAALFGRVFLLMLRSNRRWR